MKAKNVEKRSAIKYLIYISYLFDKLKSYHISLESRIKKNKFTLTQKEDLDITKSKFISHLSLSVSDVQLTIPTPKKELTSGH